MRIIGMDIHRSFAQVAIFAEGQIQQELRVELTNERFLTFARTLEKADVVVIEATGNSAAVEKLLRPFVTKVAIANPRLVRAIAFARVKTDKIDAGILARLYASGFLPEVWAPDDDTLHRRRLISERMAVLDQMVRLKSRVHAILHGNLLPKYDGDLFGKSGREWLAELPVPPDERRILERLLIDLERVVGQLRELDINLARQALDDPRARRLMTIPGISTIVATTVLASIGDIARFPTAEKLACYFGLTPTTRQSGDHPPRHGRISKQGNASARKMLVEAAWSAKKAPGPLRAFFTRVQKKAGAPAAAVATARKLAILIWHLLSEGTEYLFARPAFTAMKLRRAALKAGAPREYGHAGTAHDYWIKEIRQREAEYVEQAERVYERMVEAWKTAGPVGTG
ncbi:IS110 family transposase [Azospirillum oryzae]|nr:IS110 family transposase [Azospirillum oryzae]